MPFPSMVEYYSTVFIDHILFIHSSVNGDLSCFHFLAIVKHATMIIIIKYLSLFSVLSGVYLGVELYF